MGHVLGRVPEVLPEAHHRGLMTDGVDAGQHVGDRVGVPHVQAVTQVEHDRLVAPRGQGLHDMTPDEPGSAGDQYSHA